MKSDHIIEEIKSKIDIFDLISEHVILKRAGQNYKGLCPFHSERTPSFTVSPSKQIFHCFGCGKGGNVFTFVMEYENMTFQESLSYLADKAGVHIEKFSRGQAFNKGLKENLFAIHKEALLFFKNNLKDSKPALSYLKERGLNSETIEKFSIGFSRNKNDSLFNHLKKLGFSIEHIKSSGLVRFKKNNSSGAYGEDAFDFFRDRLMFPIFDIQGGVIAFGGRTMSSSKNIPKYINSPDSMIFKKSDSVYGINSSKNFITQKGYSIIVEGYMDTIMCHQSSINNAVAPLGTALTSSQLRRLKRFSNNVLLIFDGDTAGISATKRSIEICYAEGMISKILPLPKGEDPDTYIRRHGSDNFRKQIARAISPLEFLLNVSGKNNLDTVRYILRLISSSPDTLQRDEAIRELAERSKVNEIVLREELKNISLKKYSANAEGKTSQKIVDIGSSICKEEQMLLKIVLSMPERAEDIIYNLDIKAIKDTAISNIFQKAKSVIDSDKSLSVKNLLNICSSEEQSLITRLTIDSEIDSENANETISDCIKAISLKGIEKKIRMAGQTGDVNLLRVLLNEKKRLTKRLT